MTSTEDTCWAIPTGYGLIVPAGTIHTTEMVGEVEIKTLYIDAACKGSEALKTCRIVCISELLASLIIRLCAEEKVDQESERAFHLRQLILLEITDAPVALLALTFPTDPQLRRVCDRLISNPSNTWSIDQWAFEIGKSRRSFTRLFYKQTGLTFGQWSQRLRYQLALTKLAQGIPLYIIANDLGYGSKYSLQSMMNKLALYRS